MLTIAAQEIKRCGIGVVDLPTRDAPVHVIRNNRPEFVILREEDYQNMLEDLSLARVAASEADLKAGRFTTGSSADLMRDILEPE
ncbi:MAG TPA: prevent-host-death protein [Verrucomicrobia bacterium]|nr:prevent-host-death protein [Verrucomicrobiota bacterium]